MESRSREEKELEKEGVLEETETEWRELGENVDVLAKRAVVPQIKILTQRRAAQNGVQEAVKLQYTAL